MSMKDLLFAQAVCKKWKAIIDESEWLQKALFFKNAAPYEALHNKETHFAFSEVMEEGWCPLEEEYLHPFF